ncbi:Na(+)/H(+) antiporter NhaA [Kordiimonas sediminis]|uniref:Na(+)/H(+) antiporter NhaA n=1 Tax=Kordiimonas sediminis TaxID=1735581 RepID=A0A919E591_9PROT|nr:Na+/H+ antiporter NhaA [Kordiimonas sediminis]GHF20641.1 Na(+)/H(+) antiporter NhaA [Kordiimonas sediminis]
MAQKRESFIQSFLRQESAAGFLLMASAVLAILVANTPLVAQYNLLMATPVEVRVGALEVAKPLLLWVNDGLMAVFFLFVGLELKREFMEGELKDRKNIILPGLGAIGGMVVPALFYVFFNKDNPFALQGWAIPAATDIAFALGILALLGSKVPTSLKIFLTSLAIFDDVGAILIIAFFYTSKISFTALMVVAVSVVLLFILNRRGVLERSLYLLIGLVMWVAMLKSGVHATLAGVLLAFFIPMRSKEDPTHSPVRELEHDLHAVVAYAILPIFAFCNAGIALSGVGVEQLLHPVSLGIATGLFFGKQIGVFLFCWVGIKFGLTSLPDRMSWGSLYGVAALCGIGFTMSLFIGSLAFEETGVDMIFDERLGILVGSIASGIVGYLILNKSLKPKEA